MSLVSTMAKEVVFYNGYKMPLVGLGTWQSSEEDVGKAVDAALEAGYRHIDTAYLYENEAAIGKTLRKWFDSGKIKREELFIVTKLPNVANRKECVEKYLKRSLKALQLDYVDLYLIHNPVGILERGEEIWPTDENGVFLFDKKTDYVSLWKGMEEQVDAGRARSIGISNFNARQIKIVVNSARIQPANLQIELQLYHQQRELVAFCNALDITVTSFSTLGSPGYADWFRSKGMPVPEVSLVPLKNPVVERIAKKHNKTPAQILLKHTIQRGIIVIPKSVSPNRIKENIQLFDFQLTPDEMYELDLQDKKKRIFEMDIFIGHPQYPFNEPY